MGAGCACSVRAVAAAHACRRRHGRRGRTRPVWCPSRCRAKWTLSVVGVQRVDDHLSAPGGGPKASGSILNKSLRLANSFRIGERCSHGVAWWVRRCEQAGRTCVAQLRLRARARRSLFSGVARSITERSDCSARGHEQLDDRHGRQGPLDGRSHRCGHRKRLSLCNTYENVGKGGRNGVHPARHGRHLRRATQPDGRGLCPNRAQIRDHRARETLKMMSYVPWRSNSTSTSGTTPRVRPSYYR